MQQVTVRGPLHIVTSGVVDDEMRVEGDPEAPSMKTRSAGRTLVEVPVEVAVAISFASFLVGALSTGVLWFLHSRALRAKSVSVQAVQMNNSPHKALMHTTLTFQIWLQFLA